MFRSVNMLFILADAYPRVSDLFKDLFGINLCLPVQTFGFFVAVAFLAAYFLILHELKRKEKAGWFRMSPKTVEKGGPLKIQDVVVFVAIWALAGYKLGPAILNYGEFCSNPGGMLLSLSGSVWMALVFAVVGGLIRGWQFYKRKDAGKVTETVDAGPAFYMGQVMTIAFVAGLLGAKVFHNLENWNEFAADPLGKLMAFDGLTFYGGLLVAGVAVAIFFRRKEFRLLPLMDAFAPGLMAAYGIGRIGCQAAGDGDWGIVNARPKPGWIPEWLWRSDYAHNAINRGEYIPGCEGDFCHRLSEPVWPTPLYEVFMSLIIFSILWMLRKKLPFAGQLAGVYLMLSGTERFLIEKIRVNTTYHILGTEITQAEIISSLTILSGLFLIIWASLKTKQRPYEAGTGSVS